MHWCKTTRDCTAYRKRTVHCHRIKTCSHHGQDGEFQRALKKVNFPPFAHIHTRISQCRKSTCRSISTDKSSKGSHKSLDFIRQQPQLAFWCAVSTKMQFVPVKRKFATFLDNQISSPLSLRISTRIIGTNPDIISSSAFLCKCSCSAIVTGCDNTLH